MIYWGSPQIPPPTKQSVIEDMIALPPRMTAKDKFYIGYYENENLVAIMDLVTNYPNMQTAFIGLFMVANEYQHQGVGSKIINELSSYLKRIGFCVIRLAYVKGNSQSKAFWEKNSFIPTGEMFEKALYTAVVMNRILSP